MESRRLGPRIARTLQRLLSRPAPAESTRAGSAPTTYPGDFTGRVEARYAPDLDGAADPGEIVWGWIPYEDDPAQGKDRPALVVGRDGDWLLVLMLTSKDHDGAGDRRRYGVWVDIGTGAWDPRGRPSEVRADRVIRLAEAAVRREGAILDRRRFDEVAASLGRR